MKKLFEPAAIAILQFLIRILPEPKNAPSAAAAAVPSGPKPTPERKVRTAAPATPFPNIFKRKEPTLDFKISQQELSHIFRLESSAYQDAIARRSIEIREIAGYSYTGAHQEVHGFGATQVVYNKGLNIFVNRSLGGAFSGTGNILSRFNNMMNHVYNTVSNLPRAIMNARDFSGLVKKAHDHQAPGDLCEVAIVGQTPVLNADPYQVAFIIQAEHMMDAAKDSPVILRNVFKPVVDAQGRITGTEKIDPRNPDAQAEVIRLLIFTRLLLNQALNKQDIDIAKNLQAVADLPLTNNSRLKDYLTYQPPA